MPNSNNRLPKRKGIALLIVLCALLMVMILANVILTVVLNQARLTKHRVSRIQGYYAAQMGMVYALEKLRTGSWSPPATKYINGNDCSSFSPTNCTVEPLLPFSINNITITFETMAGGPYQGLVRVNSAANYTYTNPD